MGSRYCRLFEKGPKRTWPGKAQGQTLQMAAGHFRLLARPRQTDEVAPRMTALSGIRLGSVAILSLAAVAFLLRWVHQFL